MNENWDSGIININSNYEDLNEGATPNPINLQSYSPNYSIF